MSQPPSHSPSSHPSTTSSSSPNPQTPNDSSSSSSLSSSSLSSSSTTNAIHPPFPKATFIGDMARTYSQRTGGCNILLAKQLINLVTPSLPPTTADDAAPPTTLRILDNACGPMILTQECLSSPSIVGSDRYATVHISAVDLSPDFIAYNRTLLSSSSLTSSPALTTTSTTTTATSPTVKVDTAIMDSTSLSFPSDTFDLAFTALALFAFPSAVQGVRELHRTLKRGGVAACTTWKRVGWLPLLHELEAGLFSSSSSSSFNKDPVVPLTTFPFLEPWTVPGKLSSVLREGGFSRVEETEIEAVAWWASVDECAHWMTETLWLMVGMRDEKVGAGWGDGEGRVGKEGMREGLRGVLEKAMHRREEKGGNVVVKGEGEEEGRVGIRMVAFAGVGWK